MIVAVRLQGEDERLSCIENDKQIGEMKLEVETENAYLMARDLIVSDVRAYGQIFEYVQGKYRGCDIDFGFTKEETAAHDFMRSIGATLMESGELMRVAASPKAHSSAICEGDFERFSVIHDTVAPDMYWNVERVAADLSRWLIHTLEGGYVLTGIWDPHEAEVFCLQADTVEIATDLLYAAISSAFNAGKDGVFFHTEDNEPIEIQAAQATGFTLVRSYVGYRIRL